MFKKFLSAAGLGLALIPAMMPGVAHGMDTATYNAKIQACERLPSGVVWADCVTNVENQWLAQMPFGGAFVFDLVQWRQAHRRLIAARLDAKKITRDEYISELGVLQAEYVRRILN
jgi:hypothetical protein